MQKVLYAVFQTQDLALAAVQSARADVVDAVVHDALDSKNLARAQSLHLNETDAAHSGLRGLWLGALIGAMTGAGLHGFGLLGPLVVAVGIGALAGLALGGLAALLIGTGLPDTSLRELETELSNGGVLVTFVVADDAARQRVEATLRGRAIRMTNRQIA